MPRSREILAACLATCLLMTPVFGASTGALGTVVASDGASVGGTGAAVGTLIFSGDNLSTPDAGSVQLRTTGARFMLASASTATVNEEGGVPEATLVRGSATFSTSSARGFVLNVMTAVFRPQSDAPTVGQVTVLGPKELLANCSKGALTITVGDDTRVITEGSAYRIVLDPSEEEAQNQPPPEGTGAKGSGKPPIMAAKSKFVWYAIAAVTLLTVLAVHKALESPDRP